MRPVHEQQVRALAEKGIKMDDRKDGISLGSRGGHGGGSVQHPAGFSVNMVK